MGEEQLHLKIVVTGPESSGKTLLAGALALALDAVCAPEFARYYVAHLGRPYVRDDLRLIGRGQKAWESWYAERVPGAGRRDLLICDTDWTVLQVWEQYRFGAGGDFRWQEGYGVPQQADLYLLCAPDFPWQPDPLREHPEERDVLFGMYEQLLRDHNARYTVMEGDPDTRLQQALSVIAEFF